MSPSPWAVEWNVLYIYAYASSKYALKNFSIKIFAKKGT
jgi:hypothetical protein